MKDTRRLSGALVLALCLSNASWAQTRTITNGLVVHLSFDGNLNDDSGRANNATYVGNAGNTVSLQRTSPTFVAGKLGQGFQCNTYPDGSFIEYATLGYPEDLKFGTTNNFSIALWIKTPARSIFGGDCAYIANRNWNSSSSLGWGIFMQAGLSTVRVHLTTTDEGVQKLSVRPATPGAENLYDGAWHHIAVTCVRGGAVKSYIDGVLENTTTWVYSRDTLDTDTVSDNDIPEAVNIGQDGTGTYTQGPGSNPPATAGTAGFTNAVIDDVGLWRRALTDVEVASIYRFAQLGSNLFDVPDVHTPIVLSFIPNNGGTGILPNIPVSAVIQNQDTAVNTNTIRLLVDGAQVPVTITSTGGSNTLSYVSPFFFPPASVHTNVLIFADNGVPVKSSTNTSVFTIAPWTNIYLGTPLYVETFDELPAATNPPTVYPAGWTATNCTDPAADGGAWSLFDATSDAYQNWEITPIDVIATSFNYGTRIDNVAPALVLNGSLVSVLGSNNIAFAASDQRSGNQVDYMYTGDYNLAGQSNLWLAFNSMYSQENYQLGAIEYSIDQGNTWLPVIYLLSSNPDTIVLNTNGVVDPAATMNAQNLQIPYASCGYGNSYGAFIGVTPDRYASLAPYIRLCDPSDHVTWHRVEQFRLPAADGQSSVRVRFTFVGSNFWDWGIDNVGIYSLPPVQPALQVNVQAVANGAVNVTWNGDSGASFSGLQMTTDLAHNNWTDIPGTIGQTNYTATVSARDAYYRARTF